MSFCRPSCEGDKKTEEAVDDRQLILFLLREHLKICRLFVAIVYIMHVGLIKVLITVNE